jgi:hypothetical protein
MSQSGLNSKRKPPEKYYYVYVCSLEGYLRINPNESGKSTHTGSHPCDFEVTKDLGVLATEEQLRNSAGITSVNYGCHLIN